jgi:nucleotide-binding universal stress UspA family protein
VLHTACAWAAAIDVPSVLLHVHESPVEQLSDVIPTLCAARAQLGGASLEMLPSTFPAGAIREYVQEVDASLLALSTRGSTGTLTASTGRTATWIVRESPCPVLVSHPPAVCAR